MVDFGVDKHMPLDMARHIWGYFPPEKRCGMEGVCRSWKFPNMVYNDVTELAVKITTQSTGEHSMLKKANLPAEVGVGKKFDSFNCWLRMYLERAGSGLRKFCCELDGTASDENISSMLVNLRDKCPHLECLEITGRQLEFSHLELLPLTLKSILFERFKDDDIEMHLNRLANLENLFYGYLPCRIRRGEHSDDDEFDSSEDDSYEEGFPDYFETSNENVRLTLPRLKILRTSISIDLSHLCRNSPELRVLSCSSLLTVSQPEAMFSLQNLRLLDIDCSKLMLNRVLAQLCSSCVHLEDLNLNNCHRLTNFKPLRSLTKLQRLSVSECAKFKVADGCRILDRGVLNTLDIRGILEEDEEVGPLLRYPCLTRLAFSARLDVLHNAPQLTSVVYEDMMISMSMFRRFFGIRKQTIADGIHLPRLTFFTLPLGLDEYEMELINAANVDFREDIVEAYNTRRICFDGYPEKFDHLGD